nr:immunoglobulin light chain junction region [Macaca mulatta]MPO12231.1 immunoglobulin light chain junction region [Macaca mulatta]
CAIWDDSLSGYIF